MKERCHRPKGVISNVNAVVLTANVTSCIFIYEEIENIEMLKFESRTSKIVERLWDQRSAYT